MQAFYLWTSALSMLSTLKTFEKCISDVSGKNISHEFFFEKINFSVLAVLLTWCVLSSDSDWNKSVFWEWKETKVDSHQLTTLDREARLFASVKRSLTRTKFQRIFHPFSGRFNFHLLISWSIRVAFSIAKRIYRADSKLYVHKM